MVRSAESNLRYWAYSLANIPLAKAQQVGDLQVRKTTGYNLGVVWYAHTIEEARLQGISLSKAIQRH